MSDQSYNVEQRIASKNGYYTPSESNSVYATKYDRRTYITHWWGAPGQVGNHDQTVNYILAQADAGSMSVNYVVSDDKITMIVPPDDVSWGSGPKGNPIGVNVEHQPTLGAEGYKKAGWLLDQLEKRWNRSMSVTKHNDYMQTACPGTIDLGRIRAEADTWKRGEYDAAPVPEQPLWTTTAIEPKQIQVKPGSKKWNLGHHDFASVDANPITIATSGEVFIAHAILHHREIPQYNYYLEDASTPHGWNVLDCIDYTPPPPPYVPPAAPVEVKRADKYTLVTVVEFFKNADDAKTRKNPIGPLADGEYYLIKQDEQAYLLSRDNKSDIGWVNNFDNKVAEVAELPGIPVKVEIPQILVQPAVPTIPIDAPPTDITLPTDVSDNSDKVKHQYIMIKPRSITYIGNGTETYPDLEGKTDERIRLTPDKSYVFTMQTTDGEYFIPEVCMKRGRRQGVSKSALRLHETYPDFNHNGQNDVPESWNQFLEWSSRNYQKIQDVVKPVVPKALEARVRVKRTIDGFTKRRDNK